MRIYLDVDVLGESSRRTQRQAREPFEYHSALVDSVDALNSTVSNVVANSFSYPTPTSFSSSCFFFCSSPFTLCQKKDRVYRTRGTVKHSSFYRLILLTAIGPRADEKLFLLLSIEGIAFHSQRAQTVCLSLCFFLRHRLLSLLFLFGTMCYPMNNVNRQKDQHHITYHRFMRLVCSSNRCMSTRR